MGAEATTIKPEAKAIFVRLTIDCRGLDLLRFRNDVALEKALSFVEVLIRDRENSGDHA